MVCRYRATTTSSPIKSNVVVATPAYGATNSGVDAIGRYSSVAKLAAEPIVASTRSSDPDPTRSKARYRADAVIRKSLDVVFSNVPPSIRNGGPYGLTRPRTRRPTPRAGSRIICHVTD